eukprot:749406-Hanusia_phi.AAC.1
MEMKVEKQRRKEERSVRAKKRSRTIEEVRKRRGNEETRKSESRRTRMQKWLDCVERKRKWDTEEAEG